MSIIGRHDGFGDGGGDESEDRFDGGRFALPLERCDFGNVGGFIGGF